MITLNGTTGITTPDLASGPVAGTTANFSGNVTLGSSVLATPSGSAPSYTCRAWVNFNGTLTTGNIRASGNVSSVTRNNTGNYTVNLTTAMPDANYGGVASSGANQTPVAVTSSSAFLVLTYNSSGSGVDSSLVCVSIFR